MASTYPRISKSTQWSKRAVQQLFCQSRYLSNAESNDTRLTHLKNTPSVMSSSTIDSPSRDQLRAIMIQSTLPMIGFGFMDQTIMIHAGNAIDCTIGVSLGLSTLSAAAVGQIVANTGALVFGESVHRFFNCFKAMQPIDLTMAQQALPAVKRARFTGTFFGIILGCVLGMVNLFFIDTQRSSDLKLSKALTEGDISPFQVTASNDHMLSSKYQPATTLTIDGPDVDGILAIMLTAMKEEGFSVLEMSAKPKGDDATTYEETFVVRRKGEAIPEEELKSLAKKLLREKIVIPSAAAQKSKK